ncbi:hypothetical protein ACL02T_28465, partial [Pseudonocardia sp. RS010]
MTPDGDGTPAGLRPLDEEPAAGGCCPRAPEPVDLSAILADDALLDALGRHALPEDRIRECYGSDPVVDLLLEWRRPRAGSLEEEPPEELSDAEMPVVGVSAAEVSPAAAGPESVETGGRREPVAGTSCPRTGPVHVDDQRRRALPGEEASDAPGAPDPSGASDAPGGPDPSGASDAPGEEGARGATASLTPVRPSTEENRRARRLPMAAAAALVVGCLLGAGLGQGPGTLAVGSVDAARMVDARLDRAAAELALGDREGARDQLAGARRMLLGVRTEDGRAALTARHESLARAAMGPNAAVDPPPQLDRTQSERSQSERSQSERSQSERS